MSNVQTRISNVAHFFLSDLNTSGGVAPANSENGSPVLDAMNDAPRLTRVAPNGKQYSYPPPQQSTDQSPKADPSDIFSGPEDEEILEAGQESAEGVYFLDVLTSHLRGQSRQGLKLLAGTLAGQGKRVAVVQIDSSSIVLTDFSSKFDSAVRGCKIPDGRVIPFGGDLDAISEEWDYVLVSRDFSTAALEERFLKLADSVCVVTSPEQPKLIDSYRVLKSVCRDRNLPVGIFVVNVEDFNQAQGVYHRLAETARGHLNLQIDNFGYSIEDGTIVERELTRVEIQGHLEVYLQRLEAWKQSIQASPGTQENPVMISEVLSPVPVTQMKDVDVIAEKTQKEEFQVPMEDAAQTPCETPTLADDDLIVLELPERAESVFVAQRVGQKLLFGACPVADQFHKFLRSTGIDCIRFVNPDETGTLILVLRKDEDTEILDWILDHFPEKDDKLILVTEKPIGRFERTRWAKQFNHIEILSMVRGRFNGTPAMIIDRK